MSSLGMTAASRISNGARLASARQFSLPLTTTPQPQSAQVQTRSDDPVSHLH
jgi:hypothetical protein